jgi:hypothetical protein
MSQPDPEKQDFAETLTGAARDVPEDVASWLGRLVLLYGVPLSYLVPDEQMLPEESLRFFFLDPVWIQHLVQGACSIGSNGYGDALIDRAMDRWVQPNQPPATAAGGGTVTRSAAGVRDRLRHQHEGAPLPADGADLDWPLTGFLLRSAVVSGWRGLEVMAYRSVAADEKQRLSRSGLTAEQQAKLEREGVAPLKALRIEQLSPDVLLGLFNGMIAQLVVRQPQEGLHFGLARRGASCTKSLREMGYRNPERTGELLPGEPLDLTALGLMREAQGVIDVAALAARMQDTLARAGDLAQDPVKHAFRFTSAEFAVQMIEAAGEFTFVVDPVSHA